MIPDLRWDTLSNAHWDAFAQCWAAEISGNSKDLLPELPFPLDEDLSFASARECVVLMNFTASASAQWKFIQAAFKHADDDTLGHLAAGPVEHILGHHGEDYIEQFELWASECPRVARLLNGCWQHMMTDEVWARVCAAREAKTS